MRMQHRVSTSGEPRAARITQASAVRRIAVGWLPGLLLVGVLFALLGTRTANLMDGGLIPAESWRILHGEVPHRDFITPRPAGSAYLHILDFVLPLPLVLASKLVTLAEIVGYTLLFALLVYRRALADLGPIHWLGIGAATLVNLHQFPLIPFYTMDGLLLLAAGYVLLSQGLKRDSTPLITAGAAAVGLAATTKQSFWFGGVLVVGWLAFALVRREGPAAVRVLLTAAAAGGPLLLYGGYVALRGGSRELVDQLTGTTPVWGRTLIDLFRDGEHRTILLVALAALLVFVAVVEVSRRGAVPRVAELAARAGGTALVVWLAVRDDLTFNGVWAQDFFWSVVVTGLVRSAARRSVDLPALLVAATAWMVTLSWGAPNPGLIAGSAALYLLYALWEGFSPSARLERFGVLAGAAAASVVVAVAFWSARGDVEYGVQVDAMTRDGGAIASELRGVQLEPALADYLADARRCADRFPARWTAIVPEGALAYPVLGFRNPFPIDWFWSSDYTGHSRERLVASAAKVERRGNYLVLFQRARFGDAPQSEDYVPFPSDPPLAAAIANQLSGRRAVCGVFAAVWKPSA